jgi:hypothetical protein
MKMPENDFRSATQWILGRREIRMPVENRVCERCGNQLKPEQPSGRDSLLIFYVWVSSWPLSYRVVIPSLAG